MSQLSLKGMFGKTTSEMGPQIVPIMAEPTRLTRSTNNRLIAGVCSGIAEHYGWDPALVRIGFVILSLLPAFPGIIVYILAWIIIPEGEKSSDTYRGE